MKFDRKTLFKIGLSIFLLYLCIRYWSTAVQLFTALLGAAAPLFIGCVIAYIVNILMSFYERHYFKRSKKAFVRKSKKPVCIIAAYLTLLAIVALVIGLVAPQLVDCVQLIIAEIPDALKSIVDSLGKLDIVPENVTDFLSNVDWQSRMGQLISILSSGVGSVMDIVIKTVSSVFSGIVTIALAFIFSVYLLANRDRLKGQLDRIMKRYIKKSLYDKAVHVFSVLNDCFHRYIVGQCTEAVILGLLCTLGMLILGLPYAAMIGALVAFTALIPVAGAYIGAIAGAFMIFTVSPVQAIIFVVFLIILQQLEGNLIYPRIVGASLRLPGIWVLAAVTIGGGMMGILGMLLGVPLCAAAYRLIREDVNKLPKNK